MLRGFYIAETEGLMKESISNVVEFIEAVIIAIAEVLKGGKE